MTRRSEQIARSLDALEEQGHVRSWYVYAPGDSRGRRWVVEALSTRTYSTLEAEAFVDGAKCVLFGAQS